MSHNPKRRKPPGERPGMNDKTTPTVPTAARCRELVEDAATAWKIAPGHVTAMAAPIMVPTIKAMEAMAAKLADLEARIEGAAA